MPHCRHKIEEGAHREMLVIDRLGVKCKKQDADLQRNLVTTLHRAFRGRKTTKFRVTTAMQ